MWHSMCARVRGAAGNYGFVSIGLGAAGPILRTLSIGSEMLDVRAMSQMIERFKRDKGNGTGRKKSTNRTTRYESQSFHTSWG